MDVVKRRFRVDVCTNTQSCALVYKTLLYCSATVARVKIFYCNFIALVLKNYPSHYIGGLKDKFLS